MYLALIHKAVQRQPAARHFWFSDAGFYLPEPGRPMERWLDQLVSHRWPWMTAELLPFAADGRGNQFCFHIRGDVEPRITGIVYWSYETYRAIPLTADFAGFMDWLLVVAHTMGRTLNLPPLDEEHFVQVVSPLAKILRPQTLEALPGLLRGSISTHSQLAALNGRCASSQLVLGIARLETEQWEAGLERVHRAQLEFPEFFSSFQAESQLLGDRLTSQQQLEAWIRCLRAPLMFSGDPELPHYADIPESDPVWLFDRLSSSMDFLDEDLPVAVFRMVASDTPDLYETWLHAAVECANEGDVRLAVTFTQNASLLSLNSGNEHHSFLLLQELFESLEWTWHQEIVERELMIHGDRGVSS
jgi:hypothetical protein